MSPVLSNNDGADQADSTACGDCAPNRRIPWRPRRLIAFASTGLAGLLLIAAGVLKLAAPPSLILAPLPAEVFAAVCVGEVTLGLWLISGVNRGQALLVGMAVYAGLAAVSGRVAVLGAADCGCLGRFSFNPWAVCALDVVAAAVLGLTFHGGIDRATRWQAVRKVLVSSAIIASILAAAALAVAVRYGSIEAALRSWQGHPLAVPRSVDALPVAQGGDSHALISVHNDGNTPVRIVGTDVCCGARMATSFPRTVEPGEKDTFSVILNCSQRPSLVVTLYVESESKLRKLTCPREVVQSL